MLRSAAILLVALLCCAGCDVPAKWTDLSLPADSVRVQTPAKWKEQPIEGGTGRMYQAIHGRTEYLLGVQPLPRHNLTADEARETLRNVRDAMVTALPGGKAINESEITFEGRPGLQFEARGSKGEAAQIRVYVDSRNVVSVMVASNRGMRAKENIDKFLNSFTFDLSKPSSSASTAASSNVPPPPPVTTGNTSTAAATTPSPTGDKRVAWRYTNAPMVFPDQRGYNGVIRKQADGRWLDETETGPLDFIEVGRNDEYVELARPVGDFRVRLYNDRSEYKFGYSPNFLPMFPGKWE